MDTGKKILLIKLKVFMPVTFIIKLLKSKLYFDDELKYKKIISIMTNLSLNELKPILQIK